MEKAYGLHLGDRHAACVAQLLVQRCGWHHSPDRLLQDPLDRPIGDSLHVQHLAQAVRRDRVERALDRLHALVRAEVALYGRVYNYSAAYNHA